MLLCKSSLRELLKAQHRCWPSIGFNKFDLPKGEWCCVIQAYVRIERIVQYAQCWVRMPGQCEVVCQTCISRREEKSTEEYRQTWLNNIVNNIVKKMNLNRKIISSNGFLSKSHHCDFAIRKWHLMSNVFFDRNHPDWPSPLNQDPDAI